MPSIDSSNGLRRFATTSEVESGTRSDTFPSFASSMTTPSRRRQESKNFWMKRDESDKNAAMHEASEGVRVVTRDQGFEAVQDGTATLVDKPAGWTSFKVVKLLRRKLEIRKIGHAGTLDPMATGLLICCVGRPATRKVNDFMDLEKAYTGVLRLGETTASYDAESEILERRPVRGIADEDVVSVFDQFTGRLAQVPPMFSALKVEGRRLYKMARQGRKIEREPREVYIRRFQFLDREGRDVRFEVVCSKGTYIRSLAHDVGQKLGVGAHLITLRRTRIGTFSVDDAFTTDEIEAT